MLNKIQSQRIDRYPFKPIWLKPLLATLIAICLIIGITLLMTQGGFHPTPSLANEEAQEQEMVVMGYYPSFKANHYPFERINLKAVTHIAFAFADLRHDGSLKAAANLIRSQWLQRTHKHRVKALLSIGGWGQGHHFPKVAANSAARKKFATQVVDYCLTNNVDGIDLDWEFPANPTDKRNFVLLGKDIRQEMDSRKPGLLLTAALGAHWDFLQYYDLAQLYNYFDFLSIMTYDYHGPWTAYSGHNAPLFSGISQQALHQTSSILEDEIAKMINQGIKHNGHYISILSSKTIPPSLTTSHPLNLRQLWYKRYNNIHFSMSLYLKNGMKANQTLMGIPFYGRTFDSQDLYHPYKKTSYLAYSQIYQASLSGKYGYFFDEYAMAPLLKSWKGDKIISYDNKESIQQKIQYARRNKLRGVIIWELTQDMLPNGATPLQDHIAKIK